MKFAIWVPCLLLASLPLQARLAPQRQAGLEPDPSRASEALRRVEQVWATASAMADDPLPPPIGLEALTPPELRVLLKYDPEGLGPMSIGRPNRGALFNGVQLQESEFWHVVEPDNAWGTPETIDALQRAAYAVAGAFSDAQPVQVGHISSRHGGWLKPHRSHQSGRDADIGYFYLGGPDWYARATPQNLDVPKTWVFIKELVATGSVEYVFIDRSVQALLRPYAEMTGEDPQWLQRLFEGTDEQPEVIRHTWGHATHMHVRFHSPDAEAAGALAHAELVRARLIAPRRYYF